MEETKQLESQVTKSTEVIGTKEMADNGNKNIERPNNNNFGLQIEKLIEGAGTIKLNQEQEDILYAMVKEEDIEIRPDGLVYLPWMEYATRMRKAFKLKWALVPQGMPMSKGNYVIWGFYLVIDGRFAAYAIGEQMYYSYNQTMTWGDACEGAKSNALMRCCKEIGISLELWKPSFVKAWKEKYAESFNATYPDGKPKLDKFGKPKIEWHKIGSNADLSNIIDKPNEQNNSAQVELSKPKIDVEVIKQTLTERVVMLKDICLQYGIDFRELAKKYGKSMLGEKEISELEIEVSKKINIIDPVK